MQPAVVRIGAYPWSSFDALRASGGQGQVKPAPVGLAAADSAAIAQDNGDRVQLPSEVLMRIDQLCGGDDWPASPMIFQIRNPTTNARIFAGCLDFSGSGIGLPSSVVESLGLASADERSTPRLEVSLVHDRSKRGRGGGGLPKARAIKVQPLSSDFAADCPDPVRLLERLLPANFTALYAGACVYARGRRQMPLLFSFPTCSWPSASHCVYAPASAPPTRRASDHAASCGGVIQAAGL